MRSHLLYRNSRISYIRFGSGAAVMVAFHGYGQSAAEYLFFEDIWSPHYTVIAIDFFFHGESVWNETEDFTETDMREIVIAIANQENLHPEKFCICSFSMGARMARALVRTVPHRIERLILLSPPTISFNRFLNFVTSNFFGLGLFRFFIRRNDLLLKAVKLLNRIRILNRPVYIFSSIFIGRRERLQQVYNTWYAQRRLRTNFHRFARLVDRYGIEVILVVGKRDGITPAGPMIRFVRKMKRRKIYVVKQRHELCTPQTKYVLAKLATT